ncbi:MAG: hypothetical protein CVV12_03015 [Gammaproteobacteria bacterium HGW-Gammaproteobacteria-2]|nr:MAG: hypothetical protein CVV12_03015 [Gammaproteobacteria bacterium HGW-Gammaproteobacteria-2]
MGNPLLLLQGKLLALLQRGMRCVQSCGLRLQVLQAIQRERGRFSQRLVGLLQPRFQCAHLLQTQQR